MAATMLSQRFQSQLQAKAACSAKASRSRVVLCRAEDQKAVAKVDRSKDQLYFSSESTLQYLDGTLPGDFGFDPLGLLDPVNSGGFVTPQWLQYSEVIHARWAMLGAAGCIAPEILAKVGATPAETGVLWFQSGVIPPAGSYDNYWADPYTLFFVEVIAMQFAELRRLQDFRYPGSMGKQYFLGLEKVLGGSGDPAYPGGPFFNLFNLGKTDAEMKKLKLNEIKNGRLAMLAMFGYGAQAVLTGKGPFQNLLDHLADPVNNNILTNFGKMYGMN
jgi:light-harvesting complex I chlorophyll a/b binding protein 3